MTTRPWSLLMADTVLARHPVLTGQWEYQAGVVLVALIETWKRSGDERYYEYVRACVDSFVQPDGSIRTYHPDEYNLDHVHAGRVLFDLYVRTPEERYRKALALLRSQLQSQPRNPEGGFWHKGIYPNQMWLDGIYMASPFYARYAATFGEPVAFDDIAHQVELIEKHLRDPETRLLYHGWDQSKSQPWANQATGCSANFWGRAIGWYAMALLDILDYLPAEHAARPALIRDLQDLSTALLKVQDEASGMWYQVIDQGSRAGNYLETSVSCMAVYAFAKGHRCGLLGSEYRAAAEKAHAGIVRERVQFDEHSWLNLNGICRVGGLSGTRRDFHRNGTFEYYLSEPVVSNDYKGVGAFILASLELEA